MVSGGAPLRFSSCWLDLVQSRTKQGDQERCQRKEKGLGGKGGTRAHQSHRNRVAKLAEGRISDERFVPSRGVSSEREKGREGGAAGVL
jgi:hypothetical protein